jgi:hypothetical protein
LDVRPEGPPRLVREIEERLKLVAVVALGVAPAGPWRLIVTADARAPLKQARFWNRLPVDAGALLYCEAKAWAEKVRAHAAAALKMGEGEEAWVLAGADEIQRALRQAAAAAGARAWDAFEMKARVEAEIAREMER